jgi:hypothetical protein
VIPISLTKDWNLITRTIMPIINQPSPAPGIPSAFGLGDINPSLFLSPANAGKLIWGLGPTLTFPTASASVLGNGKWEAGPALVLLTMPGHWVIGALANNQWSYAGWGKNNVNALLVQPFINYNFPDGWYVSSSPIITANWLAASDDRWTLPIGGGVGKILKFGDKFPTAPGWRRLAAAVPGAVSFPEVKAKRRSSSGNLSRDSQDVGKTRKISPQKSRKIISQITKYCFVICLCRDRFRLNHRPGLFERLQPS